MEKFCLKWNDFEPNVTRSFRKLRHEEDFSDVTLVGDDFKPISAHKVVLSSCSEYFKNVLQNSQKHSHPVLCLEGVGNADLTNILDYIYNGELNIYQEDLDRFLTISQRLKLEGLIGQEETLNKTEYFQEETLSSAITPNDDDDDNTVVKSHEEKKVVIQFEDNHNLDEKLDGMYSQNPSGEYSCHSCLKTFKKSTRFHMREHVETHVEGLQFDCSFCSKQLRSRNALRQHISRDHNTKKNNLFSGQGLL